MATVYLHIGLPKTGTTALQHFLYNNDKALKEHDICFPDFGLRYPGVGTRKNGRFLIVPGKDANGNPDYSVPAAEYGPTLDKIADLSKTYGRIFLTDEGIWNISRKRSDFWPKLKADLADRGLDLKIIIYLRRQDSFIESLYAQKIKETKNSYTFFEFLESEHVSNWPLDYASGLDVLSAVVGKENLIIRLYEKTQYQGAEHTLFSDFLDIFGLSLSDGFTVKKELYHPSLSGTYLELKRLLNVLPKNVKNCPAIQGSISSIQKASPFTNEREKHSFFPPGGARAFLGKFKESNERVAREYLGREDGVLFCEPVAELPEEHISTEEMLRDMIIVSGRSIQILETENSELQKRLDKLEDELEKARMSHSASLENRAKKVIKRMIGKK